MNGGYDFTIFPPVAEECGTRCPQIAPKFAPMASIQKTASGYRVQVEVRGERDSGTFRTKREATDWAARRETELRESTGSGGTHHTLLQALRRYAEEESPKRRGERRELVALKAFEKPELQLPLKARMARLTDDDWRTWRDHRLGMVSRGTVLREIGLLNSVFEIARTEWKWVRANPLNDVKKPTRPQHRTRRITGLETRKMLRALGYTRKPVRSVSQAVAVAFLLALATGMRAGEICDLKWADMRDTYGTARNVKAMHLGVDRDVPLSPVARRLIERMKGWDALTVFGLGSGTLDALYRRARNKAGLEGFTFHDSRHTAATHIAKKLDVLSLCKMFGWSNPKMAMIYYNPTAKEIARML